MENPKADLLNFLRLLAEDEPELILERDAIINLRSTNIGNLEELRKIESEASTCILCRLAKTRRNVVFGVGDPCARLMFIGEAPGADEDEQGEPFVGRAGKLLTKMLKSVGLERSQVYIANILKCRPPGNRDPELDEVEACYPYLEQQVELIQPQIVIALGKVAAIRLLDLSATVSLKSLRSRIFNFKSRPLIVTYHPAALLRSPGLKVQAWEDLQFLMKLARGEIEWQATREVRQQ